jgi:hypothetical protein
MTYKMPIIRVAATTMLFLAFCLALVTIARQCSLPEHPHHIEHTH